MVLLYGEDKFIVETETTCLTPAYPLFQFSPSKKANKFIVNGFSWLVCAKPQGSFNRYLKHLESMEAGYEF